MAAGYTASGDALFARADVAIANARAIRARVRAGLEAAARKRVHRPHASDMRSAEAPPPAPVMPSSFLEPWWSIARTLADAGEVIREADAELDRAWHRVLPTIETPLSLFGG